MANFRVSQKNKEITVYRKSITEDEYLIVDRYKDAGYKIKMLERTAPRRKSGITRDDLKTYLNGVINENIYKEMLVHINNKENFLSLKSWLKKALKDDATNNKAEYMDFETYIKQRKKIDEEKDKEEYTQSKAKAEEKANKENNNKQN